MWNRIKDWFDLRQLTGLEIRLGPDGVAAVHACTLQISAERLSVKDEQPGLKHIAHFAKHYKPGPLAVCLSGKGVLSKKIQKDPRRNSYSTASPAAGVAQCQCSGFLYAAGRGRAVAGPEKYSRSTA